MRDTPVRLSREEIAILISKLPASRDELITGHLRLLKYLVRRARRLYGGDSSDLMSAATMELVHCVDRVARGDKVLSDGNITGWLHMKIWAAVRHEQCKTIFGGSSRTVFRRSAVGKSADLKRNPDFNASEGVLDPAMVEMENLEYVYSLLNSETERRLFDLRYQGKSDVEIAEVLDMSVRTVYNIRSAIGKRFLENGYDF